MKVPDYINNHLICAHLHTYSVDIHM